MNYTGGTSYPGQKPPKKRRPFRVANPTHQTIARAAKARLAQR